MMNKLLVAVLGASAALWVISLSLKGLGPSPRSVFEGLIDGDEARTSDFDGFVRRQDGYDVELRFRATEDWVASLPYLGFRQTDCGVVRDHVKFSPLRVAAWPLWWPENLTDVVCYQRLGKNEWSPSGRDFVLAETGGGWVYFSGSGREYDRAFRDAE
jgi:hypothetical protein